MMSTGYSTEEPGTAYQVNESRFTTLGIETGALENLVDHIRNVGL
jgi:hypothetical protein